MLTLAAIFIIILPIFGLIWAFMDRYIAICSAILGLLFGLCFKGVTTAEYELGAGSLSYLVTEINDVWFPTIIGIGLSLFLFSFDRFKNGKHKSD